jgi:hypothetical protein
VIKIDTKELDMALYVIDLKIADLLKNAENKQYNEVKDEIVLLKQEKQKIYKNDEQTIKKVLTQYIKDVKE